MAIKFNRTGSLWNPDNRNGINTNWVLLESLLKEFDGTRLMEVSYNLFDKTRAGDGSISSIDGKVNSDGFKNTGFISVEPDTSYSTTTKGAGAFYDTNQSFISGIASSATTFTAPSNARFFRATLGEYQVDTFMIHEGTSLKPYMAYGVKPMPLLIDENLKRLIEEANIKFETIDGLTINRGKDFPLKSVQLGTQGPVEIAEHAKNVILDAKVSGAKPGMYYRITFIGNGFVQGDRARYGLSIGEYRISDGWRERWVFTYNDGETPENYQNYMMEKGSDGIDTIVAARDDIVVSVTVDRAAITASSSPTFLNLNSGIGNSPSAVIDPSTYSAF